jgi:glutamate-5-semialdehyde dehydrogenase
MDDVQSYVVSLGRAARAASQRLTTVSGEMKTAALRRIAAALRDQRKPLLEANARDLDAARQAEVAPALVARLQLNDKRVESMATGVEQIAAQTDPVGQTLEGYVRPNGLRIEKRRCPLGVILFFYESRPNVTSDAAALCLKSGNAIILRGGKEAFHSNQAITRIIHEALGDLKDAVQLVESTDRALVPPLLKLDKYIDLVIPRGGESLIRAVVKDSTIPVLKHFTGNCHIYIDSATQDMQEQVVDICVNAKISYPGGAVCNAVEKLLFHKEAAARLLPRVCAALAAQNVEIRGDDATRALYPQARPATAEDWATEYLAFTLAIKVVDSLDAAVAHINEFGSRHTDAILSADTRAIDRFTQTVDTASVMVNTSTRFADGGEYGLGAEIGISTDKLHARGPMGAADLTTYKWIVTGNGQVRS